MAEPKAVGIGRAGLVGLLFWAVSLSAFAGQGREPDIMNTEALLNLSCRNLFESPLFYLLLLPGPLLAAGLLVSRRRADVRASLGLLFLFLLSGSGEDPEWMINTEKGAAAFREGEYQTALDFFLRADELTGCHSGLQYNIAVCFYNLGQRGEVVYHLRKSIGANPSLRISREILVRLEKEWGLSRQVPPGVRMHPDFPFLLTVVLFNITIAFLGAVFRFRRPGIFIAFVLTALLTLGSLGGFMYAYADNRRPVVVVVEDRGDLKKVPLDRVGGWLVLPEGTALRVVGRAQGYYLVRTGLGLEGWIKEGSVEI